MKNPNKEGAWFDTLISGPGSDAIREIGIGSFLFLLFFALLCAVFVSYLYTVFYSSRSSGSEVHRAFPLLGVSITAIFVCIQFSLPLSLGLLGALSIVRFRTPIKEPEEIGFLMLVIALSLACATFNFIFVGLLLFVAVIGLLLLRFLPGLRNRLASGGILMVQLPEERYLEKSADLLDALSKHVRRGSVDSVSKVNGEMVLSYSFAALRNCDVSELQRAVRDGFGASVVNIYFQRPRAW